MSMHLRGSKDMMARDESWWQSRTGLEQKLVILSTILFILSFSLTISVIVLKNRTTSGGSAATTISPTTVTGDVSTVTGETPVTEPSPPPTPSTTSDVTPSPSASTTTKEEPATSEATTALTSESTTKAPQPTSPASSTEASKPPPPPEEKNSGPRSINARAVRYNPKVFANLNGDVQGA